jgi:hypothetical protein
MITITILHLIQCRNGTLHFCFFWGISLAIDHSCGFIICSFCPKMGYFPKKISTLLLAYIALSVGIITIYQDYFDERFG